MFLGKFDIQIFYGGVVMKRVLLVLLLACCWAMPVHAGEAMVELRLPTDITMLANGIGHDVALWVDDDRLDKTMGRNLDGDVLIFRQQPVSELMSAFASVLTKAAFRVTPYTAKAPLTLLVSVQSISYTAEKTFFTSTSHITVALKATVSQYGEKQIAKTMQMSNDYEVPLTPRIQKIGEFASETLADSVRAVLQDVELTRALLLPASAQP